MLINSKLLPSLMLMNVSGLVLFRLIACPGPSGSSVHIVHWHFDVAHPQKASFLSRSVLPKWDLS